MNHVVRQILFSGPRRLLSPTAIFGSALKKWWSADDHGTALMTDDGAGLISSWSDRISSHAVTGATTARPTWTATAFNTSYAGLTFDGTANVLATNTFTDIPVGTDQSTLVVVCDPGAAPGTEVPFSYGANGNSTRRQFQRNGSTLRVNDQSSSYEVNGTATWAAPSIIVAHFEPALLTVWQDGRIIGRDDGTLNTTGTVLRIGATAATAATAFFGGPIRHVLIVSGIVTQTQREQLEGWLAWDSGLKANLPAGHPYKRSTP